KIEGFYNYRPVQTGDVIPIPSGTLHALGPGIEVVEPQIPGPTQSLEDGATYPVRYYFPGYERAGAKKMLDIDRVNEITPAETKTVSPEIIEETEGYTIERLPGNFEDKGLEVHRITLETGRELEKKSITSFHNLVAVKGRASVTIDNTSYEIPKAVPAGQMLLIPCSAKGYKITASEKAQIIDTFTPV
ncbi:MAG: hypothetical protein KAV18_07270, partial [Candidatus Omnitrophica bacterium]|nr:hypothetical protein [Candidatus Omnitrophota bacterium]